MPLKITTIDKTNFVDRPAVPSSQKFSGPNYNEIKAAVNANYLNLVFNWDNHIIEDMQLWVGQYIDYQDVLYRIDTAYNVGNPKTWNGANATALYPPAGFSVMPVELSNETNKNVPYSSKVWGYNGSADTTWNLPALSSGIECELVIINKTEDYNLLIDLSGTDKIWYLGELNDYTLLPGEMIRLKDDGTHWLKI